MDYVRLAAVALAAAALGATGCGGAGSSATLTRSQLISKADPICKQLNTELKKMNAVQKWKDIPHASELFAAYDRQASAELARLQPPTSMARDWKAIVGAYQQLGVTVAAMGQVVKTHPKPSITLASRYLNLQHERAVIANRNGFNRCSEY